MMKTKDIIIFFIIVSILFVVDIASKKYVFDHFSVVISDTAPQNKNVRILYDDQKPYVYVKNDYKPLEILHSYHKFSFDAKHKQELYHRQVSSTLKKIFSTHGYELKKRAVAYRTSENTWVVNDWQNGKRFFATLKDKKIHVTSSFFSFLVVMNRGAIWGILQGQTFILTMFSVIAIFFILFIVFRNDKSKPYMMPLAFITSGAFGNLWDRLFFNGVRDFLDFNLGFMQWPTFNLADVFIVTGVILYCLTELYVTHKEKNRKEA
ncbi:signal peptidase II [Candidatus Uabimicrobium sp. HlEnr_7]|uniref:signal peptidase II n=1 Tax=Candidatus Uabimicrobium helgolandensis TaxID=3095367 RepID=UPI003558ADCC